jgi:hypothetical protein
MMPFDVGLKIVFGCVALMVGYEMLRLIVDAHTDKGRAGDKPRS